MLKRNNGFIIILFFLLSSRIYGQNADTNADGAPGSGISLSPVTNVHIVHKPVLYIRNFQNLNPEQDQEPLPEVVKRSLKYILELTKKYDILIVSDLPEYLAVNSIEATNLTNWTDSYIKNNFIHLGFDEMISGSYSIETNGSNMTLSLRDYQFASDRILFERKYKMPTDADIFDSIDKIGLDLVPALTGKKLDVGSLAVSTGLTNVKIYIDGVSSSKQSVRIDRAIAGTEHLVEIKDKQNRVLFTKKVSIVDHQISDVYFSLDEYVEFMEGTNLTKLKKDEYEKQLKLLKQKSVYVKFGLRTSVGGGGFVWQGVYLDFQNISFDLNATFIPRLPQYIYDYYFGGSFNGALHVFRPDTAILNPYIRLGVLAYYGIELGFPTGSPYCYLGYGLTFRPDFDFMPQFIRSWQLSAELGTFQNWSVFQHSFAVDKNMNGGVNYQNLGGIMLTVGLRY